MHNANLIFSLSAKKAVQITVDVNITGFNFEDSMFNVIMMIAVNDRSQTVNYALCDADAPRSFGAVPYSEIMPIIKTSKRRVVECERHSRHGVSFSDERQLSNMAILTGSNICPCWI